MTNHEKSIVFIGLCLSTLQCKKTEIVIVQTLPCDCKNLPLIYEFKGLEGIIRFPRKPSEPYGIVIPKLGAVEVSNYLGICTDSVSLSLIRANKIVDSTVVLVSGGGINTAGTSVNVDCGDLVPFRITSLTKVR